MRVQCPKCSKVIPVTAALAGRKAKCGCGTVLKMPQLSPQAAPAPAAVAQKIEISCSSCNRRLSVPGTAAGKLVKCPCGAKSSVPKAGAAPPMPANDPFGMPADDFGHDPFGTAANDPFGAPAGDFGDYGATSGPAYLTAPPPRRRAKKKKKKSRSSSSSSSCGGPDWGQVLGGIGLMAFGAILFIGALLAGRIFPYPLFLVVLGFIGMVKGFLAG